MTFKKHCPRCHVPRTDQGTCPYCGTEVKSRWRPAKLKKDYEIFKVNVRWYGEVMARKWVTTGKILKVDSSFFRKYEYNNYNIGEDFQEFKSYPRIKTTALENQKAVRHQRKTQLFKVTETPSCEECGCKVLVRDLHRGEVVCPKCGLVQGQIEVQGGEVVLW